MNKFIAGHGLPNLHKIVLFFFLTTIGSSLMAQTVKVDGGGKISVDIGSGDPGGRWAATQDPPKFCLSIDDCGTITIEGFTISQVLLHDGSGNNITGSSFQIADPVGNAQDIEFCLDATAPAVQAKLYLVLPPDGNGIPSFAEVRVCLSGACPDCLTE